MNRFKEKFMQFMYGRYGIDTLGKWTVGLGLAAMLIAGWTSNSKYIFCTCHHNKLVSRACCYNHQ